MIVSLLIAIPRKSYRVMLNIGLLPMSMVNTKFLNMWKWEERPYIILPFEATNM
jgi:hypothetical protein